MNRALFRCAILAPRSSSSHAGGVIDGQGTGAYREAAQVTVSSTSGRALMGWSGDTDFLPNPAATSNVLTMPSRYVSPQPIYR